MKLSKVSLRQIFLGVGLSSVIFFPLLAWSFVYRKFNIQMFIAGSIAIMPVLFFTFDLLGAISKEVGLPSHSLAFQSFYLCFFLLAVLSGDVERRLVIYFVLILVPLFIGVMSHNSITAILANLRSLLIFPVCISAFMILNTRQKTLIKSTLIFSTSIACILNLAFLILTNTLFTYVDFFYFVGFDALYHSRNFTWEGDLPIGYVVYDFFSDHYTTRHVGLFASPDKLAYLFLILVFYIYSKLHNWAILLLSLPIFIYLHVKVLILFILVFLITKSTRLIHQNNYYLLIAGMSFSAIFLALALLHGDFPGLSESGALHHLWGLYVPFVNADGLSLIFGNGLGAGGTIGRTGITSDLSKAELGGESFIGSMFFQGGLYLVFIMLWLFRELFYKSISANHEMGYVIIAVLATYTISEASASFFQSYCFAAVVILCGRSLQKEN